MAWATPLISSYFLFLIFLPPCRDSAINFFLIFLEVCVRVFWASYSVLYTNKIIIEAKLMLHCHVLRYKFDVVLQLPMF